MLTCDLELAILQVIFEWCLKTQSTCIEISFTGYDSIINILIYECGFLIGHLIHICMLMRTTFLICILHIYLTEFYLSPLGGWSFHVAGIRET